MYSENPARDALRVTKAALMNQVARFTPGLYVGLTGQTGRGNEKDPPARIAAYFRRCFNEYMERLGVESGKEARFLRSRSVLEYGPGDVLGVALLMYAHGASSVQCVDRFPLKRATDNNLQAYRELIDTLGPEQRERACRAFVEYGEPESGFDPRAIAYAVTRDGLIGRTAAYDLIISRAVLEHVDRLDMTMDDMASALRRDGIAIHKVDLKSHGMDRYHPFDFLTWPEPVYRLMNSHKGNPNRWRVDKYRELVERNHLRFKELEHTGRLEPEQIERIRPSLAAGFRDIPTEELSWLGFWMVLEHALPEPALPEPAPAAHA